MNSNSLAREYAASKNGEWTTFLATHLETNPFNLSYVGKTIIFYFSLICNYLWTQNVAKLRWQSGLIVKNEVSRGRWNKFIFSPVYPWIGIDLEELSLSSELAFALEEIGAPVWQHFEFSPSRISCSRFSLTMCSKNSLLNVNSLLS
jgi:hypothetical protein